ncbi:MAG: alpha/beta fold hydrolase [Candidatus Promineofilum sp.]|nr:alpha/beta fold hydrolase [Promineifilum sp.]
MPFQPTYDVPSERRPYQLPSALPQPPGRRIGVLFLHGFMGSPLSSRPLAEHLTAHGLTARCPLLPGHGHFPDKLATAGRKQWLAEAEEAFAAARAESDELFLVAHSMGNILAAHVARKFGGVRGIVMLAPVYDVPDKRLRYVKYARFFMPWYYPHKSKRESMQHLVRERCLDFDPTIDFDDPAFQATLPQISRVPIKGMHEMVATIEYGRTLWPRLDLPVRIFAGEEDPAAPPDNARRIFADLPNADKQLTIFPHTGHEMMRPFDPAHDQVWSAILNFIEQTSVIGLPTAERAT